MRLILLLLIVFLIVVAVYALPNAIASFSGSHTIEFNASV